MTARRKERYAPLCERCSYPMKPIKLRYAGGGETTWGCGASECARRVLNERDQLRAEVEAFRQAIRDGDGPSCEDVCTRECIGVCGGI